MINSIVLIALLLASPIKGTTVEEQDFELHPSLGVVLTVGDYLVAYPIIGLPSPVDKCDDFITEIDKTTILCYNKTMVFLGEPSMFRPAWCEDCIWQSMDDFPQEY